MATRALSKTVNGGKLGASGATVRELAGLDATASWLADGFVGEFSAGAEVETEEVVAVAAGREALAGFAAGKVEAGTSLVVGRLVLKSKKQVTPMTIKTAIAQNFFIR